MIVGVILWLCAAPLIVAMLVFMTEVGCGLRKRPPAIVDRNADAVSIVVLIPAHDEAPGIVHTVQTLVERSPAGTRILVVADNCSDATADLARGAGAEVIERQDEARRGKGFALAFGRDHLSSAPPECVIVIDADSVPDPGTIRLLADRCRRENRPIQACYLMQPKPGAVSFTRFSSFAFLIKNLVRQQGIEFLGAPVVLDGCGMAFTWASLAKAPLANDEVAEDVVLGVHMAMTGFAPRYESGAVVLSPSSSIAGTDTQRKRWESGFIRTARLSFVPLMRAAVRRGDFGLVWLALHLATPPFVLLIATAFALTVITGVAALFGLSGFVLPLLLATLLGLCLGLVAIAWRLYGRAMLPLADLARLPAYALWKLRLSLSALLRAERRWIRTERTP